MKIRVLPWIGVLLLHLLLSGSAFSQPDNRGNAVDSTRSWDMLMHDPDATFESVQQAFYNSSAFREWEELNRQRGLNPGDKKLAGKKVAGYKMFKRWEHINQFRVQPDGRLETDEQLFREYVNGQGETDSQSSAGGNWTLMTDTYPVNLYSQPTGQGRINAIAFHPSDSNTIYIGTPSGGIWKTTSPAGNATEWTDLSGNLPALGISSILLHPDNPDIIYIGTGDRDHYDAPALGVFKTTDGGITWNAMNPAMGLVKVGAMVMNPGAPNTIVAATSGGLYKTTNGGAGWTMKLSGDFLDIKCKPGDFSILYAFNNSVKKIYRSENQGETWSEIISLPNSGSCGRMVLGVTPAQPSWVYVAQCKANNTFQNIYRSTDEGLSFTAMAVAPPNLCGYNCDGSDGSSQSYYNFCIAADPQDANILYVGGINIWKSVNGGATWSINTHFAGSCVANVHGDQHEFCWSPANKLFVANDGGIYCNTGTAQGWEEITGALPIAQVYRISQGATQVNYLLAGTQDNGTIGTTTGNAFVTVCPGDGGETEIDNVNPQICYVSYVQGPIFRTTNGPAQAGYTQIANIGQNGIPATEAAAWITPFHLHKGDHNTLFAGYKNVYRCNAVAAASPVFTAISSGETNPCLVIEQSAVNPNILYVVRGGSLKRTENANAPAGSVTWTVCALPGGSGTPSDIKTHPTDASIVYAASGNKIYRSASKGTSWSDISGNLPMIGINTIAVDRNSSSEGIYIGNRSGVWYKNADMPAWIMFSSGLPSVDVRELEIYYDTNPANNRIKAGTYGRGLWQSELIQINAIDPANFSAFVAGTSEIDLSWSGNQANEEVLVATSPTPTFGQPTDGTAYTTGDLLPGGGSVICKGSLTSFQHTGLAGSTVYYYKIWSVNGNIQYSPGVAAIMAKTDCEKIAALPYTCSFDEPGCWQVTDQTGQGGWSFGYTTNPANPPAILTSPYAYVRSNQGSAVNFNTDLISPPFDLTGYSAVVLKFNQHYDGDASWSSTATVSYSINYGQSWTTIATYTIDQNNQLVVLVVPAAANQPNVKFRWNYTDDALGSYMWGIDDVQITSSLAGIWKGTISTDWNNAGNWWDITVPTSGTDVYIPAGVPFMPYTNTTPHAVCRDLTVQTGASVKPGGYELQVKGNWYMNGSVDCGHGNSTVVRFNGATHQMLTGAAPSTLKTFILDNPAGATLQKNLTCYTLKLMQGVLNTGSNVLYNNGNGMTRISGWVNGKLKTWTWGTTSLSLFVGDSTEYTPVTLTFPTNCGFGTISVQTTGSDHPSLSGSDLDCNKSVNRYYTFGDRSISFSSCTATFNYSASDLDDGTSALLLNAGKYTVDWSYPVVGTRTTTATSVTGLTPGDLSGGFVLAEPWKTSIATGGNWSDPATWTPAGVPVSTDNVRIIAPGIVTVDIQDASSADLEIQSDAGLLIDPQAVLTVNGDLIVNTPDAAAPPSAPAQPEPLP